MGIRRNRIKKDVVAKYLKYFITFLIAAMCTHHILVWKAKENNQEDEGDVRFIFRRTKESCEVRFIIMNQEPEEYYLDKDFFARNNCNHEHYDFSHGFMLYEGHILQFKRWLFHTY